MPPIVAAVVPAVLAAASAYTAGFAFGLIAAGWQAAVVAGLVTFAFSYATSALSGKPKQAQLPNFTAQQRDRITSVRSPIAAHKIVYGRSRAGGPLALAESTGGTKEFMHLVVPVAGHEVAGFDFCLLNDVPVPVGTTVDGRYANLVRVAVHTGNANQEADADLVAEVPGWTTDHRLRGLAYAYVRLKYSADAFPTGIPGPAFVIRGREVFDPRTGQTAWSNNPALCLRDYLTADFGLGAAEADIDDETVAAAANICDEYVAVVSETATCVADPSADTITVASGAFRQHFETGDCVTWNGETRYAIPLALASNGDQAIALASTLATARAGVKVPVGVASADLVTVSELRYTLDGVLALDATPMSLIEDMLTAMAGVMIYSGGRYRLFAAAAGTATADLGRDQLRGAVNVQARPSRRELYNAVRGTCPVPEALWQPGDFPPVTNTLYETQDAGVRIWRDIELPLTARRRRAQRIAKIHLEQSRQGIVVQYPATFAGLAIQAWDVVRLTLPEFGFAAKEFRVVGWSLAEEGGVDLVLQEYAAAAYDWNSGDETEIDLAPDTQLPSPFNVGLPGVPVVDEVVYATRDGAGVKARADVTWAAAPDAFVDQYQLEFKMVSDDAWTVRPRVAATLDTVFDMAPGTYQFRVKAINRLGISSGYATSGEIDIYGLAAAPEDVSGLTISAIGGMALLRWIQAPDLDVRIGGRIEFRHSQAMSGATWESSTGIGHAVPGVSTFAVMPLKEGTYLAKAVDSSGTKSANAASVTTKQAALLAFANLGSVVEDPTFAGTKTNVVVDTGVLKLDGAGDFDDIADLDAVDDLDAFGGVARQGTYLFSAGLDLGSVKRTRLTSNLVAAAVIVGDLIDERATAIDDWADFDGNAGADADCVIWVRDTDDDPAGTPTWGAWNRLDSAEFEARGFEFKAEFETADPAYNIHVTEMSVSSDEVV